MQNNSFAWQFNASQIPGPLRSTACPKPHLESCRFDSQDLLGQRLWAETSLRAGTIPSSGWMYIQDNPGLKMLVCKKKKKVWKLGHIKTCFCNRDAPMLNILRGVRTVRTRDGRATAF